jgi:hypothetical protein
MMKHTADQTCYDKQVRVTQVSHAETHTDGYLLDGELAQDFSFDDVPAMVHLATKPLPYLADFLKEPAGARVKCESADQIRSALVLTASTARLAAEKPMSTRYGT